MTPCVMEVRDVGSNLQAGCLPSSCPEQAPHLPWPQSPHMGSGMATPSHLWMKWDKVHRMLTGVGRGLGRFKSDDEPTVLSSVWSLVKCSLEGCLTQSCFYLQ